ncbi:6538_t:CDS:10 [Funneliformis mosseae]|uniref:6538_t:CDS:1 n=1 Tax=Funneliformis mosseae TaxID=27381 RepID=A0A9N9ABW1_FUNMO|nr:6538_t:CDS:10 [Funneliformis mosseae]
MKFYNFILVFATLTIISFAILPIKSQNIFTYEDIPSVNASDSTPTIFKLVSYDDNTIVVHIIRPDLSYPIEKGILWVDKYLSLRTIYPNGSVVPVDIKLDIQDFNYCILDINGSQASPIRIYPIRSNFLIVTYAETTNLTDPLSYTDWAMVVDLNGNIYSKISFGPSFVDVATNQWYPDRAKIFANFDPDKGFIRYTPVTGSTNTIWQQYIVTEAGEINLLAQDNIPFKNNLSLLSNVIPMVDSKYAIVFANSTDVDTIDSPLTSRGGVYIIILDYSLAIKREPAVLYQTQIQGIKFINIDCSVSYVGIGQTCIVTSESTIRAEKKLYLKIDFLSSGTVINVLPLMNDIQTNPLIDQYNIASLPYGGYLLSGLGTSDGQNIVAGYLLGDNGESFPWNLPINTVTNFIGASKVLRNNTYVLAQLGEKPNWSLVTTELKKFELERDHGYDNFHIDTTSPVLDEKIALDIESLKIIYYNEVDLSVGLIKIFHENGNLRQIIPGTNDTFVTQNVDGNLTTVNIKLLNCTLNQPGSRYYVSIENNFVKSRVYQEPLYGVKDHVWTFTTPQIEEEFSESVNGQVRLTANGTVYFESLNERERKIFTTKLTEELADAIPVSHKRVTTNERIETDALAPQKQIFLSININQDETRKERTVKFAIRDLDNLIKNKFITVIASGEASKYLDDSYGYHRLPDPLFTHGLLGAFAVGLMISGVFFFAKDKLPGVKDTTIFLFKFCVAISDIGLDWVFIITKAKNVGLFIPSLVILIGSFNVSLVLALRIIDKELRDIEQAEKAKNESVQEENSSVQADNFKVWFNKNNIFVNVFTILAGTDLDILTLLDSKVKFGGFVEFNANFSKKTVQRIVKYSCINIILENIPQLVIQSDILRYYTFIKAFDENGDENSAHAYAKDPSF